MELQLSSLIAQQSFLAQFSDYSWWFIALIVALIFAVGFTLCFPYFVFIRIPACTFFRLLYRVKVKGQENVPATGPALLVCNHVSHIDAPLVMAHVRRPVRFLIWAPFLNVFILKPFLRVAKVIPVNGQAGPRAIIQSLRNASEALARGELVCIFAEGGITRTGFLLPFQRGLEQIVKRTPAPIIPVYLDHVWGSVFSFRGGRFFWKFPRQFRHILGVNFGKPLPSTTPAPEVRLAIQELSADSAQVRFNDRTPVHRQFVRSACWYFFRPCFIDPNNADKPVMTYGEALVGAKIFRNKLRPRLQDDKMVGLWLPPSPGGAIANIALALLGKTAVNLNYTSSPEVVRSSICKCGIRRVLTSRLFVKKVPLEAGPDVEIIYLEDFRKIITKGERIRTYLATLLTPWFWQEYVSLGLGKHSCDDILSIIFSSGSTGDPKGIMLANGNIAANAESVIQAADLSKKDRLLGILPFFHSFGYTVTLWCPLQVGMSTVFHPNPLAAKEIGETSRKYRPSLFLSTPTFLRSYLKRCEKDDFSSLRILMCGAEKLPSSLAEEFKAKFNVEPLEGYGCTELSPVAAANIPDWVEGTYKQIGNKRGTIGRTLPGVAARICHRETLEPLPLGSEGLLLVTGANVMKGYLNQEDLTQKKIKDGWYITGDIARIDEEGFITITGREERFAKVGGEMVPLEKVEEELHHVLETNERTCVVTAIPDERKGERLVVLHLEFDNGTTIESLRQGLGSRGLPNIYIPGQKDFFRVEELPILGSGKLDLKQCKQKAQELVTGR